MYENMTYEQILQDKLDRVSDSMDKREGSVIYDALAPNAIETANMYMELDTILNQTFADTATGVYLDKRCAERGITRQPATGAVMEGRFRPPTLGNMVGKRFSCGDYNYIILGTTVEYVDSGTDSYVLYPLQCETAGAEINGVTGQLIPIDYVEGLKTADITKVLIPGEDEESDDSLRTRYYATLNSQAFGGNITDYKQKTNSIAGVGGTKVTPTWNGGGTVKLTIIASDFTIPTDKLIQTVQSDMTAIAPIGHEVTVESVEGTTINIASDITYQSGWNWESVKDYVNDAIDAYFLELSKTWQDEDKLMVRISQIETRLLGCSGIIDVSNTKLNGDTGNIQLESNCIPVKGDVSDGTATD